MPAGMCSRQKAMWRPTMRVLRPLVARGLGGGEAVRTGADDEDVESTRSRIASPCPPPPHSVATP